MLIFCCNNCHQAEQFEIKYNPFRLYFSLCFYNGNRAVGVALHVPIEASKFLISTRESSLCPRTSTQATMSISLPPPSRSVDIKFTIATCEYIIPSSYHTKAIRDTAGITT